MAIYSFNKDSFGKSTNTPGAAARNAAYNARETATRLQDGTAGSNAAYNAREEVTYAARSFAMPTGPDEVEAWFRAQETADRKNARMSDRFIGALPRELTPEQCLAAVEGWCRDVTGNRVPWHFGLHLELENRDKPDWNPHAHIIIRDRDIETGKRHLYTSAGKKEYAQLDAAGVRYWTVPDFRQAWESHMNRALENAGHQVRIDARSNAARGIEAEPGVHVGRAASRLLEKGQRPQSSDVYLGIDGGETRVDANEKRKRRRSERPPPDTPEERARQELNRTHGQQRSEIAAAQHGERLALRALHRAEFDTRTYQDKLHHREARNTAYQDIGRQFADRYQEVRGIGDPRARAVALEALTAEQTAAYAARSSQLIADARPAKDTRWREMKTAQGAERAELEQQQRQELEALRQAHEAERLLLKEQLKAGRDTPDQVRAAAAAAVRDAAALSRSQSMVNVEGVQMDRMRRRADQARRQQQDATAKAGEHQATAENWRERAERLRSEAEQRRETTDRRSAQQAKLAEAAKALTDKSQKGKDDREPER